MVLASIGEQASTALFLASTSYFTFCNLRAASILKKHLVSTEHIKIFGEQRVNKKQFANNDNAKSIDEVIEN